MPRILMTILMTFLELIQLILNLKPRFIHFHLFPSLFLLPMSVILFPMHSFFQFFFFSRPLLQYWRGRRRWNRKVCWVAGGGRSHLSEGRDETKTRGHRQKESLLYLFWSWRQLLSLSWSLRNTVTSGRRRSGKVSSRRARASPSSGMVTGPR